MRLNTECLQGFIGYYIKFSGFNETDLKCVRILRLTRRSRRLFLDDYSVAIEYCEDKPRVRIALTDVTKKEDELTFASPEQAITRVRSPEFSPPKYAPPQYYQPRERYPDLYISSCVEPVDILWFIPYVDSLTLGKYDGKLISDDAVESESKKSKFDDEEKVWKEYEEVTIRLIKSLENVKMKKIACDLNQTKVLSHLLIADTWIVSNDDFTVERYNKRLIVEVSSPHKCLVDFLDLAYGTKCDDTEKLEILILEGYEDCHITDIHKLQEYLPLLQNIIIYWNYDGGNLATAIVEPLMATKFERPMKITIATDDSYSDDDYIIEMVNLILKWRELDPNVSIKLCITDKYGIEDQLSDEVLHEFKKIASTPDWPQEYSFVGDRLEVIVTEEID